MKKYTHPTDVRYQSVLYIKNYFVNILTPKMIRYFEKIKNKTDNIKRVFAKVFH